MGQAKWVSDYPAQPVIRPISGHLCLAAAVEPPVLFWWPALPCLSVPSNFETRRNANHEFHPIASLTSTHSHWPALRRPSPATTTATPAVPAHNDPAHHITALRNDFVEHGA